MQNNPPHQILKQSVIQMESEQTHSPIPKARLVTGTIVFVTGFLMPLLVPVVARMDLSVGLKTTLSGLLLLGIPEIFMLITVAILGKDGYNFLKSKILILLKKHGPPQEVSKTRYRIGLIMFCIPLCIAWILPYIDHHLPQFKNYEIYLNVGGDILLLLSFIVLGGEFWDKIRSLFIYKN